MESTSTSQPEHRRTVKGLDAEACAAAWALYLEVKHKVQILVQNKIADPPSPCPIYTNGREVRGREVLDLCTVPGQSSPPATSTYRRNDETASHRAPRIPHTPLFQGVGPPNMDDDCRQFSTSSANENHRLPGLAFADDLVIMAENREDLQTLLDICQVEICASGYASVPGRLTDPAVLTLGGEPVAICNEYRYLGVTLCAEADKYSFHETALRQAALRAQRRHCNQVVDRGPPTREGSGNTIWSKEMESKSTLELYRGNKRGINAECFYDNSIGSSLLFEARAGAMRTIVYRSRFQDTGMSTKCRLCGAEAETQEHLILRCAGLQIAPAEDTDLPRALGFHNARGRRWKPHREWTQRRPDLRCSGHQKATD
ncbi:hypothetical protein HPB49_026123 [Dermacentor silvarum]|nr:hypothetical protein HPB49_026123 [Dermacentor silvarum]